MDAMHHALTTILADRLGWPCETAADIARYAHIVSYDKDAHIFHAGESTDLCYILLAGEVKLYYATATGERVLVTIFRGEGLLGLANLGAGDGHDAQGEQLFTAQALSRCKVAIIARMRLTRALRDLSGPQVLAIVEKSSEQWRQLCSRFLGFLTMTVRGRLAHAIKDISNTFGIDDARGKLISLKLSHEDFAELVGASRPMVSKHLKELAQTGAFAKVNGRYILAREDLLAGEPSSASPPVSEVVAPKHLTVVPRIGARRAEAHRGQPHRPAVASRRAAE
jgi:CRP/FNR family cyclic AMP-dependent transcriptional regulator